MSDIWDTSQLLPMLTLFLHFSWPCLMQLPLSDTATHNHEKPEHHIALRAQLAVIHYCSLWVSLVLCAGACCMTSKKVLTLSEPHCSLLQCLLGKALPEILSPRRETHGLQGKLWTLCLNLLRGAGTWKGQTQGEYWERMGNQANGLPTFPFIF